MSSNKEITFVIDEKGDFTMDLEGFHGKGCGEVAAAFSAMGPSKKEVIKDEYYKSSNNGNTLNINS